MDEIKMQEVESSTVKAIGYDETNKILRVEFKSSSIYDYKDVPADIFLQLKLAESAGKFLSANVIKIYSYECMFKKEVK